MCGILGVYNFKQGVDTKAFQKSLRFLKHRGPDYQQSVVLDDNMILGHARLSIIDLSSANHQPFAVDDRYTLTFNGEIYNYLELRAELELSNVQFNTSGDTEVLLQAYINWGEGCVNRFNGMWAFAIYDKVEKKLFCSRDRFGVKPFNYHFSEDEFIFSSEIKPLLAYKPALKEPNHNIIANYCYKSIGAQVEETWFKGVMRLLPGHNMIVTKGKSKMYRYWHYPQEIDKSISFDDAKKRFKEIFVDAVKLRMRSDVRVGSTLSSGLDSTSIVGVIDKMQMGVIDTFTAYSPKTAYTKNDKSVYSANVDLDESRSVRELLKEFNVNPTLIEVSFDNYVSKLKEAIYYLESGHSSPATICIHQVYKNAREKVKVLLEGQGADELLGGYILDNFPLYLFEKVKDGEIQQSIKELLEFKNVYSLKYLIFLFLRRYDNSFLNSVKNVVKSINIFNDESFEYKYVKDNYEEPVEFDDNFNKSLYKQHSSGLGNLLHYGDALSMAESIECRLPFMDYRLVELAFKLPYNYKVQELKGKFIQRKALEEFIPEKIAKSVIKIGFATPLDNLISHNKEIEEILLNESCGNFFNNKNIGKLLESHRSGKDNHATLLFRILSAKLWYRTFFTEDLLTAQNDFTFNKSAIKQ